MKQKTLEAFFDELEKTSVDWSMLTGPAGMFGAGAGMRVALTNAIQRFGSSGGLNRELRGVGARTALRGNPLPSKPARHLLAIAGDAPSMHEIEQGYAMAKKRGARHPLLKGVPLQHGTGWKGATRKSADYLFTPVSQVGRDIAHGAKRLVGLGQSAPRIAT
jgi:hypothetical protein